jgi:isoquinoline 1-oxidoreductase beta subunit
MSTAISRRALLKAGTAALSLGWLAPVAAAGQSGRVVRMDAAGARLNAWVSIDAKGKVTLTAHRAEMGQGAYSVVPQILAEELEVDPASVAVVVATGDGTRYGNQITGGSSTVRDGMEGLLRSGAAARDMLVRAAAARWGVAPSSCRAQLGQVMHTPSGRKLGYGALVADAARLEPAKRPALKPRHQWRVIGTSLPRWDLPAKVNGSAVFGIDFRLPGMLFAVVERCPRFEGRLRRFDAAAALAVPGVKHVIKVERDVFGHRREGVAVVATSSWAAMKGRRALVVEWDDAPLAGLSSASIAGQAKLALDSAGNHYRSKGNPEQARAGLDAIDVVYETPYQAHACLEPLNCSARWQDGVLDIWGPIQGPDWMQTHLSEAFKLPREKVRVQMTLLGGAFGRKAFTDYVHEAADLARALEGTPVQVLWTREDDMTAGPFRPAMSYRCRGAVRKDRIASFETLAVGQNMAAQNPGAERGQYNGSIGEGLPETYFNSLSHYRFADAPLQVPVPVMWWRAVYSSTNAFAYESFIDELAASGKLDPIALRRRHFWTGRAHTLADRLEEVSGWKARGDTKGYGVAITECFESWVGYVIKVSRRAGGGVGIDKVWAVIDCGVAVNPDGVRAQVEGSMVMALGAATMHEVTFAEGKAVARNFDVYPMPRLADIPPIEVHIITNEEKPGGAGEPALPGFAPALTNAIFDLTGKRLRKLPVALAEI